MVVPLKYSWHDISLFSKYIAIITVVLMCHKSRRIRVALLLWHVMQDYIILLDLRYDLVIVRIHHSSKYISSFVLSLGEVILPLSTDLVSYSVKVRVLPQHTYSHSFRCSGKW